MTTVKITNVSPLGDLDVPILGRVVTAGESVDVDVDIAGAVPDLTKEGDSGSGLLAQVGTWAPASTTKKSTPPADSTPLVAPEGDQS